MKIAYKHPLDKKVFQNKLFKPQVNTLRFLGYIVRKNDKFQRTHYWFCLIFTFSIAILSSMGFAKLFIDPQFSGGSAMSAATTFLFLSTFIAMRAAFTQRDRLAQMLIFLQKDIDKFLLKSDEIEDKLFEEMYRYIKVITFAVWGPTSTAAFIAFVDGVYRLAIGNYWYPETENERKESYTPPLMSRLFPLEIIANNFFFGFVLPTYGLFAGIVAIPLWHTFVTSLMSYVNLKCKVMHKRISEMDFGKLIVSHGQQGGSAMSPATAFLYLTTSIAILNAFFRRKKIARMLNYLQNDLDKLKANSDEIEEGFFKEAHRYMDVITYSIWTPSLIAGFMAYLEAFFMMAFDQEAIFNLEYVSKVILEPNEKLYYSSLVGGDSKLNFLRERMCKFSVVEQIRIRWFACELQELIGVPVFADFIIFSILICFLFYELVTGNPTKMDFVFMCLYLFVMSSILWLYHWHATLMKENSVEMGFAIYSCDWYNYPLKIQKIIQLAMIITARPLEITAVLVPLSLTTFIDIIRAAYSYFSLLRKTSD